MDDLPDDVSPKIRPLVEELNAAGFVTTDSGDGSNLSTGMDCGWEVPMVVIEVKDRYNLISKSHSLKEFLDNKDINCSIEATYSPVDYIASIVIYGKELVK